MNQNQKLESSIYLDDLFGFEDERSFLPWQAQRLPEIERFKSNFSKKEKEVGRPKMPL